MLTIPYLERKKNKVTLIVDGKPFIVLGFQWSCDLSADEDFVCRYFRHAKNLGCNTAVVAVYWSSIEPVRGVYQTDFLEKRIAACREAGLKMILLWFGAYKNAQMWYVPNWVYEDTVQFPRLVASDGTVHVNTACPLGVHTLQRDREAFLKMLQAISKIETTDKTVIMVQIENEAGLLGSDRCYCSTCNKIYKQQRWKDAEMFTATHIARYIENLAASGKKVYPLPFYANAWLDTEGFRRPGIDYPSGGPCLKNLDIYKKEAPHVDFFAPDIYSTSYRIFSEVCAAFAKKVQPLFIAEHSTYGEHHRAEKNIFYALGDHAAIGFDPYCINNNTDPVVGLDGTIHQRIIEYRDSLKIINDALTEFVKARQSKRLKCFVAEEADSKRYFILGKYAFQIGMGGRGRGFVILLDSETYLIGGVDIRVEILDLERKEIVVPDLCEWGCYEGSHWKTLYKASRETLLGYIPFAGPSVAKISFEGKGRRWEEKKQVKFIQ